jgi:hypothetical protein
MARINIMTKPQVIENICTMVCTTAIVLGLIAFSEPELYKEQMSIPTLVIS